VFFPFQEIFFRPPVDVATNSLPSSTIIPASVAVHRLGAGNRDAIGPSVVTPAFVGAQFAHAGRETLGHDFLPMAHPRPYRQRRSNPWSLRNFLQFHRPIQPPSSSAAPIGNGGTTRHDQEEQTISALDAAADSPNKKAFCASSSPKKKSKPTIPSAATAKAAIWYPGDLRTAQPPTRGVARQELVRETGTNRTR
jgi:hypothetical protein